MEGLGAKELVTVPIMSLPIHAYVEGRSTWMLWAAAAGTQSSTYTPPPPAEAWDGSQSACDRLYPVPGEYGAVFTYKRQCFHNYKVDFVKPDTLPGGARVGYVAVKWTTSAGETEPPSPTLILPPYEYACADGTECLSSVVVELQGGVYGVLARSEPQTFGATKVLSSSAVMPLTTPKIGSAPPSRSPSP